MTTHKQFRLSRTPFYRDPDGIADRITMIPEPAFATKVVAATSKDDLVRQMRNFGAADRMTRIRSHVEQRGHGCERWLPLWRVLATQNEESPELKKRIRI